MARRFPCSIILFLIIGFTFIVLLFYVGSVSGRTITVDDDGGAECEKIQDAIDNATDGDTIRVFDGTYYENVIVNKSVSLIGNGSEVTTTDGGGSGDVVTITADWVNMSGFLVTGSGDDWGNSGIRVESDHNHIFENYCSNNDYGIRLRDSSRCTITNNTCSLNNIGICLVRSRNNTLENNTCSSNNYYGIVLDSSNNCTIENNTCSSNNRCGIDLRDSSNCTLENNIISGNRVGLFLSLSSSDNTAHYNEIYNSTEYGINAFNNNGFSIDAIDNWWGDPSGPYHPTLNPTGIGDNVTNSVEFDPWIGKGGGFDLYVDDDAPEGGNGSKERPFNRIQDAIDAADHGDSIRVWEGTYEEQIIINKTLSLIGNSSATTIINGTGEGDVVTLNAMWINVSGFRISSSGMEWPSAGIRIFQGHANIYSSNCSGNYIGIYIEDSDFHIIQMNVCNGNEQMGLYAKFSQFNIVENNIFNHNDRHGIWYYGCDNTTVFNNTFLNNDDDGIAFSYSSRDNYIHNNTANYNGNGISLWPAHYNRVENNTCNYNSWRGIALGFSNNNLVENNICINTNRGIVLSYSFHNTLRNNNIESNRIGIQLTGTSFTGYSKNNTVYWNTISDNTEYGIDCSNNDGNMVNAVNNWWGDASGPYHPEKNSEGKGDTVTDYVEFDPWIGKQKTWYVDDDSQDGGDGSISHPFNGIQDAINASENGDTIRVFNGTYHENPIVNSSVSLIGNGSEVTTIYGGGNGNVVTITADWVNMSGFRVTGSGTLFLEAGIKVESDHNHIFENNCSNTENGIHLSSYSRDCKITNNTCSSNNIGICLGRSRNNTLENNTCSSNNYGILLWESRNNTLKNNTCSSNNYYGIVVEYSSNNTLEDNTCSSNNYTGIILNHSSDCTLVKNKISGNRRGISLIFSSRGNIAHNNFIFNNSEFGINATKNDGFSINATYNWWGDASGPYHATLNPEGRGDNVSDYVIFDPWIDKEDMEFCSLSGHVIDPYGNPLDGVLINITCVGFSSETTSNESGYYEITGIPIVECVWTITASKYGYKGAIDKRSITEASVQNLTLTRIIITWYVDDDSPDGGDGSIEHPFNMIQDAINASKDGDTIQVFEGTYHENVVVNKSVSLIGNGSEVTTINGGGESDVVNISADWCNMSGFSVTGSGYTWQQEGAGINVVANHTYIRDMNCTHNHVGIFIKDSNNCMVSNTTCMKNNYGIHIEYSKRNSLTNVLCSSNSYQGIFISYSSGNSCSNVICSNNKHQGIFIRNSKDSVITNTNCSNSYHGIDFHNSENNTISNTTCSNNEDRGIYMENTDNNTIENAIFCWNGYGIEIVTSNYTIIDTINSSDNTAQGIQIDYSNYNIISNSISSNNGFHGIGFFGDCKHNAIVETTCSKNTYDGISIWYSSHINIKNTTCSNNNNDGIVSLNSSKITIANSTCTNNARHGFAFIVYSNNNTIIYNTISGNRIGIQIMYNSNDTAAHYNNIFNNSEYGINSSVSINATHNYWGHSSGPYHPTNNSHGQGDNITDYVDFEPWLDENGNAFYLSTASDEDSHTVLLFFLVAVLVILFLSLIVVVRFPDGYSTRKISEITEIDLSPEPEVEERNWDSFKPPEDKDMGTSDEEVEVLREQENRGT